MRGPAHAQEVLSALSQPRTEKYLAQMGNHAGRALQLYKWDGQLSASMGSLIALFEVVLRNSICHAIDAWSDEGQKSNKQWIMEPRNGVREPLSKVIVNLSDTARAKALNAKELRDNGQGLVSGDHPRKGHPLTRDDVVAQVTLQQWKENFFYRSPEQQLDGSLKFFPNETRYKTLKRVYEDITSRALSAGPKTIDPDRASLVMHHVVLLRNRISHQEPLVDIDCAQLRREIFELMNCMEPSVLEDYSSNDPIPGILKADPRSRRR